MNIENQRRRGITLLLAGLLLFSAGNFHGCSDPPTGPGPDDIKILFVGNSLTKWNGMPDMLRQLARQAGQQAYIENASRLGTSLAEHTFLTKTLKRINEYNWDYVILQEGSARIAFESTRPELYPQYQALKEYIWQCYPRSQVVLFLDWSPDDGIRLNDGQQLTFFEFQQLLHDGTLDLAEEFGFLVAPVGWGWKQVYEERPDLVLTSKDTVHPSKAGSYLQACIYFATIFQESPVGLKYRHDVTAPNARYLQEVAAEVVLSDPAHWFLPTIDPR
ncbi:SGNH/GDSL hydrolase family protein [Gemmatimonadota bacterium]